MLTFRLLGAVELGTGQHQNLSAGQPRQRAVLTALLVDVGRVLATETLIDRVWADDPPGGARRALQVYVVDMRKLQRQAGGDLAGVQVVSGSGGYRLDADPESVDLHRFRRLVGDARRPGCGDHPRASLLREAMALWHGEPLTGIRGEWAARMRVGWEREQLEAAAA